VLDLTHFPVKPSQTPNEVTLSSSSLIAESEGGKEIPSVLDLIRRFLVYPPASRLWAEDALRHPWFVERLDGKDLSAKSSESLLSGLSLGEQVIGDGISTAASVQNDNPKLNAQKNGDPAAPLLLLPPGYALQRGRPDLKNISLHVWCGWTLADLLEDVVGDQHEEKP
jgi:serine/threonine protein kinase